jgi:peptidoglycan hydrolase-like protein with peptidoglycan-binding domain
MKLREIAIAVAALSLAGTAMAAGNDMRSTTSERLPTARQGQPLDQSTQAQQEPQGSSSANSARTNGSGSAKMDDSNASSAAHSQGGMANEEHDTQRVQSVQQALKQKGYDAGAVDGRWGPNTQDALRQFQQSQGITPSGNLDAQTLSALGVDQNQATQGGMSSPSTGMSPQGATPSSRNDKSSQGGMSSSQGTQGSQASGHGSTNSSIQGSAYK